MLLVSFHVHRVSVYDIRINLIILIVIRVCKLLELLLSQVVGLRSKLISEHLELVRVNRGGDCVSLLVRFLRFALVSLMMMMIVLRLMMVLWFLWHWLWSRLRVSDHDSHAWVRA